MRVLLEASVLFAAADRPAAATYRIAPDSSAQAALDSLHLRPGDSVLFRRGETYRVSVTAKVSGTPAKPVVYASFGKGDPPILSGAIALPVWKPLRDSVFVAECPRPVRGLFVDGRPLRLARHPNRGYLPIDRVHSSESFASSAFHRRGSETDWRGASVHVKSERFSLDARKVAGFDSEAGRFRLDRPPNYPMDKGEGFFVNGAMAALDTAGEWFWDASQGRIFLRLAAGEDPSGRKVEAAVREHGLKADSAGHLRIRGLRFIHQAGAALLFEGSVGVQVRDCVVEYAGEEGIRLEGSDGLLAGNRVLGAVRAGIQVRGSRIAIEGNRIEGIGNPALLGAEGFGGGCCRGNGLEAYGDANRLVGNRIIGTAYNGIRFEGWGDLIERNHIDSTCLHLDDGGGIYSWSARYPSKRPPETLIRHNVILNVLGSEEGNGKPLTSAHGIYLDHCTQRFTISGNTVSNADLGIYLHNTRDHRVTGNVFYGNREKQIFLKRDYLDGSSMRGNRIEGNLLFATGPGQQGTAEEIHGVTNPEPLAVYARNHQCAEDSTGQECRLDGKRVWRRTGVRGSRLILRSLGTPAAVRVDSLDLAPGMQF